MTWRDLLGLAAIAGLAALAILAAVALPYHQVFGLLLLAGVASGLLYRAWGGPPGDAIGVTVLLLSSGVLITGVLRFGWWLVRLLVHSAWPGSTR